MIIGWWAKMNKCYKCEERVKLLEKGILGCHSFCLEYKKYQQERERIRKIKLDILEDDTVAIDRYNRIAKKKPDKITNYRRWGR